MLICFCIPFVKKNLNINGISVFEVYLVSIKFGSKNYKCMDKHI